MKRQFNPAASPKILIRVPANKITTSPNMVSMSETSKQVITQSNVVGGSPVQVQNLLSTSSCNVLVRNTPLIIVKPTTMQPSTVGKNLKPKPAVCGNCGATFSKSQYKCCTKSTFFPRKNVVPQQRPVVLTRPRLPACSSSPEAKPVPVKSRQRLNASTFYGGKNSASEFSKFLKAQGKQCNTLTVKRVSQLIPNNSVTKPASELITISDSSDEADAEQEVRNQQLQTQQKNAGEVSTVTVTQKICLSDILSGSDIIDDSPIPCKRQKQSSEMNSPSPSVSVSQTLKETNLNQPVTSNNINAWKTATLNVPLKSVRIGQFHCKEHVNSRWSGLNISMTLPHHILNIPWYGVNKVELSLANQQACVFVTVHNDLLAVVRHQLGMMAGKVPYFDPEGSDDQVFIVFYFCPEWVKKNGSLVEQKLTFLQKKLTKPQSFFIEISVTEANNRQCRIADAELVANCRTNTQTQITENLQNSKSHQVLDEHVVLTSSPFITPSSQQQVFTITMSPEHQKLIHYTRSRRPQTQTSSPFSGENLEVRPVFTGLRKQLAIYPRPPAKGGISITNQDQFCLNDGEFLNDVIIDFYLKYVMLEIVSEADRKRSHVFSCFFYKRLTQNPPRHALTMEDKSLSPARRRHNRVQKWTRGVDIFSKDFVFIPINEASHWFLAVICFPGQDGRYFVDPKTGEQVSEDRLPQPVPQPPLKRGRKPTIFNETSNETKSKNPLSVTLNGATVTTCTLTDSTVEITRMESSSGSKDLPNSVDTVQQSDIDEDNDPNVTNIVEIVTVSSESDNGHSFCNNNSPAGDERMEGVVDIKQTDLRFLDVKPNGNTESNHISGDKDRDVENSHDPEASRNDETPSNTPDTTITSDGQLKDIQFREPCILIFDSLRGPSRSKTSTTLREYLNLEWETRKESTCGKRTFDKNTMKMSSPQVPQQDNYSDCGVFLLEYVEKIFQNPISSYALPIKNLHNWFDPIECKEKRKTIKDTIDQLHNEQNQQQPDT